LSQTFTDWICEVHNDLPGNTFPEEYIRSLNDSRFIVVNHPVNLGTTASFNYAFKGCTETYASMLEDDNWWEPTFLEVMVKLMDDNPHLDIAWSNMSVWKELPNRSWVDTGATLWPTSQDICFNWPQPAQALGALHSTGAMIYRGDKAAQYSIPESTLSNAVELVRERCFEHPIFLQSKPLANFSYTIASSQSRNIVKWTGTQMMMLSSYLAKSSDKKRKCLTLLSYYRNNRPSPVPVFMLSIFFLREWRLLSCLNISDWLICIRWFVANFFHIPRLRPYLKSQQQTWTFLKNRTPDIIDN
jgi:glycosyltransferase involved in cell wall biosynthesis